MYVNKFMGIVTDILPDNCNECLCSEVLCRKPMKAYPHHGEIRKAYLKKRHKECPLIVASEIQYVNGSKLTY